MFYLFQFPFFLFFLFYSNSFFLQFAFFFDFLHFLISYFFLVSYFFDFLLFPISYFIRFFFFWFPSFSNFLLYPISYYFWFPPFSDFPQNVDKNIPFLNPSVFNTILKVNIFFTESKEMGTLSGYNNIGLHNFQSIGPLGRCFL